MKIIRIHKGKVFPLPFRLVAVAVVMVSVIKIMDTLPEPWSIFLSILVAALLPATWFATHVIIINEENKTIFDGAWIMGFKIGKLHSYHQIEKIFINSVKTSQTMYSLSNQKNVVTDREYRAYLKVDDGTKFFLVSHPLEDRLKEKVTKIREKLGIMHL